MKKLVKALKRKLRVKSIGKPMHIVEGQLIIKNPPFLPKKGAKVIIKSSEGQVPIGVADFPFGRVESPYLAVNLDQLDEEFQTILLNKELFAEKYVNFRSSNRRKNKRST